MVRGGTHFMDQILHRQAAAHSYTSAIRQLRYTVLQVYIHYTLIDTKHTQKWSCVFSEQY